MTRIRTDHPPAGRGPIAMTRPTAGVSLRSICCIVLAGALCYGNTLHAPFYLDDGWSIVNNPLIRNAGGWRALWSENWLRFLGNWSFALNYHWGALDVTGYHLVNLAIHIGASLATWWLALLVIGLAPHLPGRLLQRRATVAVIAALIFALHPLQTQAVTYIVQRFASLAALWYLLSTACFVTARRAMTGGGPWRQWAGWIAGAVLFAAAAFLTKESSFSLPVCWLMCELLLIRRAGRIDWRALGLLAGLIVVLALSATLVLHLSARETQDISRVDYLATQFRVIFVYLRLVLLPVGQNFDYDFAVAHGLWQWPVIGSLAVLLALLMLGLWQARRNSAAAFGIFWFFIALSVESGLVPIRDVIFEHRMYLPMAGLSLAAACGLAWIWDHTRREVALAVIAAVLCGLGTATFLRNAVWADDLALWSDTVAKSPRKARPHDQLGQALAQRGCPRLAIAEYHTAATLDPSYTNAWYNLGVTFAQLGMADSAEQAYDRALAIEPGLVMALNNRGTLRLQRGSLPGAESDFQATIAINPRQTLPYYNLGRIAYIRGDALKADSLFTIAAGRDTLNYWAWFGQGVTALALGQPQAAITPLSRAIRLAPAAGQFYYVRSLALAACHQTPTAAADLELSRRLRYHQDPAADWFLMSSPRQPRRRAKARAK